MSTMTEQVGELGPIRAHRYGAAPVGDGYRELDRPVDRLVGRLVADEPFALDVPLTELLPGGARRSGITDR